MVAIGSARPLSRDEILACLRAYLAESPAGSAPPASEPEGAASTPSAPSLAAVLDTVIAAVGHAADTPDAPAAPLDRSAWSVAVGRFTSSARKLSAVKSPPPGNESTAGS